MLVTFLVPNQRIQMLFITYHGVYWDLLVFTQHQLNTAVTQYKLDCRLTYFLPIFQLVGMITRYNLTHEYMEHCLDNLDAD